MTSTHLLVQEVLFRAACLTVLNLHLAKILSGSGRPGKYNRLHVSHHAWDGLHMHLHQQLCSQNSCTGSLNKPVMWLGSSCILDLRFWWCSELGISRCPSLLTALASLPNQLERPWELLLMPSVAAQMCDSVRLHKQHCRGSYLLSRAARSMRHNARYNVLQDTLLLSCTGGKLAHTFCQPAAHWVHLERCHLHVKHPQQGCLI